MLPEVFDQQTLPATHWKNGGGLTRQIVSRPIAAGLDDFSWRVSIARIDRSGPFSRFDGVDRVIVLLDGCLRLYTPDGAIDAWLDQPFSSLAFAGEHPVECQLRGGPSSDFNLMVRRDRMRAECRVVAAPLDLPPAGCGLVFAARGDWLVTFDDRSAPTPVPMSVPTSIPMSIPCGAGVWWALDEAQSEAAGSPRGGSPTHVAPRAGAATPGGSADQTPPALIVVQLWPVAG